MIKFIFRPTLLMNVGKQNIMKDIEHKINDYNKYKMRK